jgi:hypothetical protein
MFFGDKKINRGLFFMHKKTRRDFFLAIKKKQSVQKMMKKK